MGGRGPCHPYFNFPTKHGSKVSVSNIRDIAFYGCSEIMQTRNFTIFTVFATIFGQFTEGFFLARYEQQSTSRWTFWKVPILNAGLSEKFLIPEHLKEDRNEQDFEGQIISGILDLLKKSLKTRKAFIKLNMIASILDFLKIFSEVIERDSSTSVFL